MCIGVEIKKYLSVKLQLAYFILLKYVIIGVDDVPVFYTSKCTPSFLRFFRLVKKPLCL